MATKKITINELKKLVRQIVKEDWRTKENLGSDEDSKYEYEIPNSILMLRQLFGMAPVIELSLKDHPNHRVHFNISEIPKLIEALQKIENGEILQF